MYASDIVNSNNCTYLAVTEYSEAGTPTNAEICITGITDINDRDVDAPIIDISEVVTSATVGEEVLVSATATDNVDENVLVAITIYDSEGETISVVNGKFVPEKAGTYVVVFTAVDAAGNIAEQRAQIEVEEAPTKTESGCLSNVNSYCELLALLMLVLGVVCFSKKTIKE